MQAGCVWVAVGDMLLNGRTMQVQTYAANAGRAACLE